MSLSDIMRRPRRLSASRLADRAAPDAARRIGVLDVGSNSVRLVVFETISRSPAYFFNEKVLCGLGSEIADTGRLSTQHRGEVADRVVSRRRPVPPACTRSERSRRDPD